MHTVPVTRTRTMQHLLLLIPTIQYLWDGDSAPQVVAKQLGAHINAHLCVAGAG